MSVHKLFLDEPCYGRLGKGGEYNYDDSVLEVKWYGEKIWQYFPRKSAVMVRLDGAVPEVEPLSVPRSYPGKLLWLCGVPKQARCKSMAEYDTMVEGHTDSPVKHEGGPGWQIAIGLGPQGRDYIVAGWVDPRITAKQRRKMLQKCGTFAPDWFVEKILSKDWK